MNLKLIYIISVLIGYIPGLIKRTIYLYKIDKCGYDYFDNEDIHSQDIYEDIAAIVMALIPFINIIKGIKDTYEILDFKSKFAKYKLELLFNDRIYRIEEKSNEEELKDFLLTFGDMIKIKDDDKEKLLCIVDIVKLYEYAKENNYEIDEKKFDEMSFDDKLNYLKEIKSIIDDKKIITSDTKNKSKSFTEMSIKEQIDYLKKEKEDILNNNYSQMQLKRKK